MAIYTGYDRNLIDAISRNSIESVREILDNGADVNAHNPANFYAAIHYAATHCAATDCQNRYRLKLLIEYGADIHALTRGGSTALHVASGSNNIAIAELLIDLGLNIHTRNNPGQTPLHTAARAGSVHCMEMLLKRGALIDAKTNLNRTALHLAAEKGLIDAVMCLLENNADTTIIDDDNQTASHIAIRNHKNSTAKIIDDFAKAKEENARLSSLIGKTENNNSINF